MGEIPSVETMARGAGDRARRDRLMRWATYASTTVALVLIMVKLFAWVATDSVAMLSSLIDSMLDAGASLLNLLAVHQALQPADAEHRVGHGKAVPLAGLGQSAFIAGSAAFLRFKSGDRLLHPQPVGASLVGIGVMVFSIVLTGALLLFQRYVVRRTGSMAIGADSLHYASDLLTNLAVIAALVLAAQFGFTLADPLFAAAIGLFILYSAWQILARAYDHLMDREFPDDLRWQILQIAQSHQGVYSVHELRTRSSGSTSFIQMHLEMDATISLLEAHSISEAVETDLLAEFPGTDIIIHQDPAGMSARRSAVSP
jgi:ferrous-iron efflux pump FieF